MVQGAKSGADPASGRNRQTLRRTRLPALRLEHLLNVAAEVFIERGFQAASTNDIARRAAASKNTFYARFPSKELLFLAVLEQRMAANFSQVSQTLPLDRPLELTLEAFAQGVLRHSLSKQQMALLRVVSTEARRFPQLAARYAELGPLRGQRTLSEFLAHHSSRGTLSPAPPHELADTFIGLVMSGPVLWYALGILPQLPDAQEQQTHVRRAVNLFMRAHGTGQG